MSTRASKFNFDPAISRLNESRALFLIIGITALVYANSLSGEFIFDDIKQIVGNPALRSWDNIVHAFTSDVWDFQRRLYTTDVQPPYYRPLFTVYLTIGYQLFGLWEPGWHLMSLAVHTAATVLVFYLIRELSGNIWVSGLASLIFGLHPAHVESVSWISGIPDPLAALFYIPAVTWYVRYRRSAQRRWLGFSLAAFFLALMCKETPIVLPLVLLAWEVLQQGALRNWRERIKLVALSLLPYLAIIIAYLLLRYTVLNRITWKHMMMERISDEAIWLTIPYVLVKYGQHLFVPFHLSLVYGTTFVGGLSDARFLWPTALLLCLLSLILILRHRMDANLWMALALLFAPLLPVLNLKVFHFEYIVQDRYLYLPSIGFAFLVAQLAVSLARRSLTPAILCTSIALLAFGVSTVLQNRVWHDPIALWQRAIDYAPQSWMPRYNLGLAFLERKDYAAARTHLIEAAERKPDIPIIYNNLALAQAHLGEKEKAIENFQRALMLDPAQFEARNNLGTFLFERGDYQGAREQFTLALATNPSSLPTRFNLGRTLAAMNDHAAAIREYEQVLAATPNDEETRSNLAKSYAALEADKRTPEGLR